MCGWPVFVRSGTGLTFLSHFVNFRILLVIKHTCKTVTKYLEFNPNREKIWRNFFLYHASFLSEV